MKLAAVFLLVASIAAADRLPDPKPVVARVLKIEVAGSAVIATASAGTDQGVARTNACTFIDTQDKPTPADCNIVRVDKRTTIVKTNATMDQIKAGLRVSFHPSDR